MALQIRGSDVLTLGEYIVLCRSMPRTDRGGGVLAAMHMGEEVTPMDAFTALEIRARLSAGSSDVANKIIDRASARLKAAFPDEVPA